jgi:YfiH family protein
MIRWEGDHLAVELPGARGVFTTRRGGVSEGSYASLNLGDHVGDDPAAVAENRARAAAVADRPWSTVHHARQVHGATVSQHKRSLNPPHSHECGTVLEADGQMTDDPGAAAAVFVADCLPVLLANDHGVAAIHAGWRGVAAGVLEAGVEALGGGANVQAALGPSARGCCYEVGEEVHAALPGGRRGERNLDLAAVAKARLEQAGADWIHDIGLCTMCSEPSLFFSHRRDGGTTGRQAGIVWRA